MRETLCRNWQRKAEINKNTIAYCIADLYNISIYNKTAKMKNIKNSVINIVRTNITRIKKLRI